MKIIFDLDDTLASYSEEHYKLRSHVYPYPQHNRHFYKTMPVILGAVSLFKYLKSQGHDVYIATAPSVLNPETYTGKAVWVLDNLGQEALDNLIIISDKSLLQGDILIDDHLKGKGQEDFKGLVIHSPLGCNWLNILVKVEEYNERAKP